MPATVIPCPLRGITYEELTRSCHCFLLHNETEGALQGEKSETCCQHNEYSNPGPGMLFINYTIISMRKSACNFVEGCIVMNSFAQVTLSGKVIDAEKRDYP